MHKMQAKSLADLVRMIDLFDTATAQDRHNPLNPLVRFLCVRRGRVDARSSFTQASSFARTSFIEFSALR